MPLQFGDSMLFGQVKQAVFWGNCKISLRGEMTQLPHSIEKMAQDSRLTKGIVTCHLL